MSSTDNRPERLLRGAWVAPMGGPLIREGGVVFRGNRIIAVGEGALLARRHPDAGVIDRPGDIVLPGLINAHTHLELSEFTCGEPPAGFVDWLMRLVPKGTTDLEAVYASVARSVPMGVSQCLRYGVTTVGDISRHCTVSRPLLAGGPLNVVSYGEVQAMARRRALLGERLAVAADRQFESDFLRTAISPHAPYSVETGGYRQCLAAARHAGMPLATHLAETPDEAPFLRDHTGRFRDLWQLLQAWDDDVPTFEGGPIRFAEAIGLLDYERTLLAHVNYCDDDEMNILAGGRASVVYCPRTHAYFGHPPHRWREMLAAGINVAIGTDSCASSPDLNLVDELRLLHRITPDEPAKTLWEMATLRGAVATARGQSKGILAAGYDADFTLFAAQGDDPLASILEANLPVKQTWIGGEPAYQRDA